MNDMMEGAVHDHSHWLVAVAAIVCVIGSCLTVLLSRRLIQATDRGRHVQLVLTSIIAGATIWSTHFIAMLVYDPGVNHGYDPVITVVSLGVAVVGMFLSNVILASGPRYPHFLFSGATFGLTVSTMHYLGMAAYLLPGIMVWDMSALMLSISFGVLFGAAAHHRIAYPVTRYCLMAGACFMVVAICTMHFTGMVAFEIVLDSAVEVPPQIIADQTLAMLIMTVTAVILFVGFASISIESNVAYEAQNRLQFAALHDPMTGLPNRMLLDQEMNAAAERLETDEMDKVAVLTIDLNFFKEINDLYGHATGDTVLKTISTRISDALQPGEFMARAGGDEFIAIKRDFRRVDQVTAFAERIHALIVEPIDIHYATTTVGAAIGVATSVHDGRDVRDLLHKSDLAMYRAKAEPETHICMFNAEMDRQSQDRLLLVKDLREATANGEFELAYQFQNDMASSDVIGFEALLRWNHPERGRVSPGEFIPLAEEIGLIREIGLWVMRTACTEAAQWATPYSVAVNVAPSNSSSRRFWIMCQRFYRKAG